MNFENTEQAVGAIGFWVGLLGMLIMLTASVVDDCVAGPRLKSITHTGKVGR